MLGYVRLKPKNITLDTQTLFNRVFRISLDNGREGRGGKWATRQASSGYTAVRVCLPRVDSARREAAAAAANYYRRTVRAPSGNAAAPRSSAFFDSADRIPRETDDDDDSSVRRCSRVYDICCRQGGTGRFDYIIILYNNPVINIGRARH